MKPRSIGVVACAAVVIAGLALVPSAFAKTKTVTKTVTVQNASPATIPPQTVDMPTSTITDGIGSSTATLTGKGTVKHVTLGVQVAQKQSFDLSLYLFHGSNYVVLERGVQNGPNLANFGDGTGCAGGMTVFDSGATLFLFQGINPFDGTFLPAESFDAFNGDAAAGGWKLVAQNSGSDAGTINCVQATVTVDVPKKKKKK